jgi:hypothetical protein
MNPLQAQNDQTNDNIEFLQPYPVVAADALLEIGTTVISAVLSLDVHLSPINISRVPKCYQSVYCCLTRYLSGYKLLNASWTAAKDFNVKSCSIMNTRSAREYTMFVPAHLLRNWRERRSSNQSDLDSSVTRKAGRVHYPGVNLLLISFLCRST